MIMAHKQIKYLTIGHVCMDIDQNSNYKLGGTVSYSGQLANALNCSCTIMTSYSSTFKFEDYLCGIELINQGSEMTTCFGNDYSSGTRVQKLFSVADEIRIDGLSRIYPEYDIIHIAPIFHELDLSIQQIIPEHSFCLVTPQGWLRDIKDEQIIKRNMDLRVFKNRIIIISQDDIDLTSSECLEISEHCQILVVTRASQGASLFVNGKEAHYKAIKVKEIDPTGAGDIFAAAFAIEYYRTGNADKAVKFAIELAGVSVSYPAFDFLDHIS